MTKEKAYIIRELRTNETELLKDFLYEAIFIPEGVEPPERDIIENHMWPVTLRLPKCNLFK